MEQARILIVDDEPFNVDYLEQELEDSHVITQAAFNGQQALEKVLTDPPDLILLDIMMPVLDGFAVLKQLKADPDARDIPIIIISAANEMSNVIKGIQLGAEDYLSKPFEPTLLHARIKSCLEKKSLRDLEKTYTKGLEREMEIGREIQTGFLPTELPIVTGWELAALFKAAREVAGDFYDAFLLSDGNLVCVVGDVCGKGVGAALFMTLFRSLIRITSTTDVHMTGDSTLALTPKERLQHVISFTNHYITSTHSEANMFATLFICLLNPGSGKLVFLNCGHQPPLIISSWGDIRQINPTSPAIGVIPEAEFIANETILNVGDMLLVYTDGVPDAMNQQGEPYGDQRLQTCIQGSSYLPSSLLSRIEQEVRQFIAGADQFDDITMLAMKRMG